MRIRKKKKIKTPPKKKGFFINPPKNKNLKSESSGDWQKEKDQTPKKEDLKEKV
ncbi:hypothetical protein ACLGAT_06755 [Helicobacter pylori]